MIRFHLLRNVAYQYMTNLTAMNTVDSYNFENKKALVRVDFNVPLNDNHEITDFTRIKAAVPTIKKILNDGGSAILMSHLGRPKGTPQDKFSLRHIYTSISMNIFLKIIRKRKPKLKII